jgi:hypothetical protein
MAHRSIGGKPSPQTFVRHARVRRRGTVALAVAGGWAALLLALAPVADAQADSRLTPASAASTYCAHLPASKVSAIVGWAVRLEDAMVKNTILVCLYVGSGNVSLEKDTPMSISAFSTRAKAEAMAKEMFPKGTPITFSPLPALGATAFYWTAIIGGHPFSGANDNRGVTGYYSEMSGSLQRAKLVQLERLAISA